jgi:tripartite-type tricarboxylate transporter receptor subunit TctC
MIACFWLLPLSAAAQVHAQAQQYPSKSVTIISDSAAGSTPDAVLRVIADRLSQSWGQQVLAEAITFVQAEQRRWKPVLELIANKTN